MKIFIIDDDPIYSLEIESILSQIGYELAGKADSYEDALIGIKASSPDVVICDIRLDNDYSGLDLANKVVNMALPFIFMTAYSDEEVYRNTRAYPNSKFIVKPFDKLTLKGMLDDLKNEIIEFSPGKKMIGSTLFIRKNNVFKKTELADIEYLFSEGNYITLHSNEKKHILKYSLSRLQKLNIFDRFIRIHRNYAVNKMKIESVSFADKILVTKEGMSLPIGRTYTKPLKVLISQQVRL